MKRLAIAFIILLVIFQQKSYCQTYYDIQVSVWTDSIGQLITNQIPQLDISGRGTYQILLNDTDFLVLSDIIDDKDIWIKNSSHNIESATTPKSSHIAYKYGGEYRDAWDYYLKGNLCLTGNNVVVGYSTGTLDKYGGADWFFPYPTYQTINSITVKILGKRCDSYGSSTKMTMRKKITWDWLEQEWPLSNSYIENVIQIPASYFDMIDITVGGVVGIDPIVYSEDNYEVVKVTVVIDYTCDPPGTPSNVNATDDICGYVDITWTGVTGATKYQVKRGSTVLSYDATSPFTDSGASMSSTTYYVYAGNSCGWSTSYDSDSGKMRSAPNAPSNVAATDGTCDYVDISWSSVTGATKYRVKRSNENLSDDASSPFRDSSPPSTSTLYYVYSGNDCGWSTSYGSNSGYASTQPSTPSGISASNGNYDDYVKVTWNDVSGETGFKIQRDGANEYSVPANTTSWNDNTAIIGKEHSYRVNAVNTDCGDSDWSDINTGWRPTWIRGRITSLDGGGVQGILVSAGGKSGTTDANGYYKISGLQWGDYTVTPSTSDGHTFEPPSIPVSLNDGLHSKEDANFIDKSTYSVGGNVTFQGTSCGVNGVEIRIDGGSTGSVFTDPTGHWTTSLPLGNHTFQAIKENMDFSPSGVVSELITGPKEDINFECTTFFTLILEAKTACGEMIPNVSFSVETLSGCLSQEYNTGSVGVAPTPQLSPLTFTISAFSIVNPGWFEGDVKTITLTSDQTVIFLPKLSLIVDVIDLPQVISCADLFTVASGEIKPITIRVQDTEGCLVDGATVVIIDEVGDKNSEPINLTTEDGFVSYDLKGGNPAYDNPPNYTKSLTVEAYTGAPGESNDGVTYAIVVTGAKLLGESFITALPEIPIRILHDPPGDLSYSLFEKTETFTQNISLSFLGNLGASVKAKAGKNVFGVGAEISGEISAEYKVAIDSSAEMTFMTHELVTSPQSNDDPTIIGPGKGDLFVGIGMNIRYGLCADVILNECNVVIDTTLFWAPDTIETVFLYPANHILNRIIESDCFLDDDPSSCRELWQQILDLNPAMDNHISEEELKYVTWLHNYSITGGTIVKEYSETLIRSVTTTFYHDITINSTVSAKLGLGVGSVEGSATAGITIGRSSSLTNVIEERTGYYLGDDDAIDLFEVDVYRDDIFGTPLFISKNSVSSCPWEFYTSAAQSVSINPTSDVSTNSKVTEVAAFEVSVCNLNFIENASGSFRIYIPQETNTTHVSTVINGVGNDYTVEIPHGECRTFGIEVSYGASSIGDTSMIVIVAESACDAGISDSTYLKVNWEHIVPVSELLIGYDPYGMAISDTIDFTTETQCPIWVSVSRSLKCDSLTLQARVKGYNNFVTVGKGEKFTVLGSDVDYYRLIWDLPHMVEGTYFEYEVRAQAWNQGLSRNSVNIRTIFVHYYPIGIIEDKPESLPYEYALFQNYPNPFNPETNISFSLPELTALVLTIYDMRGNEVTRIAQGQYAPGYYSVTWKGFNMYGQPVPTGIYIYNLRSNGFNCNRKMIYMK